jgi:DNA-binding NarL/FixJ family response regulator
MRLVIVDDSVLVRGGLALLLKEAGVEVLSAVGSVAELASVLRSEDLDAVILDIRMPPTFTDEGLRAAQQIRSQHPRMGILVLSQFLESEYAMRLLTDAPEHIGYLLKDRVSDVAVVLDALHRVIEGECVLDPTIVNTLIRRPRDPGPLDELTERELGVLELMAQGRSNTAIAERLYMSPRTLETHVRRILQKLDLQESPEDHRRVLAVLRYLRGTGVD